MRGNERLLKRSLNSKIGAASHCFGIFSVEFPSGYIQPECTIGVLRKCIYLM